MLDRLRLQLLSELRIPRASAGGVCQVQSVTTPPRKVTIAPMLVEIQPTKIGLEAISSEELKIQNLLQDFPDSPSVNCGDRYGFDRGKDGSVAAWQIISKTQEDIAT